MAELASRPRVAFRYRASQSVSTSRADTTCTHVSILAIRVRRPCSRTYCTALVGGSLVVVLGAALSFSTVAAAIGMFVVMFTATFATAFGGYRALHVAPIALAYSLSALGPLSSLGIGDRVAGWTTGGVAALVAATFMWPIDRRRGLRTTAAALSGDLADSVRSLRQPCGERPPLARVQQDAAALQASLATPLRPYGPARRDVLFVHLIEHLSHAVDLIDELVADDLPDDDAPLVEAIATSLNRTRALLAGDDEETSDVHDEVEHLDRMRSLCHERIEHEAAGRSAHGGGVEAMQRAVPLLGLSHVVLWIEFEARAMTEAHARDAPTLTSAPEVRAAAPTDDLRARVRRGVGAARAEVDPDGVILRNSIRAGIALAAAIVVAEVLPLEHGFWIVLATLLVLHSSAHSTFTTAVGAIAGTLVGISVGSVAVLVVDDPAVYWVLLPIAVGIAAYFPGGVNFIAGQAGFGLLVIVLFELLDYPGLQTAVVRAETVAVGVITATVLSLVLWPRGARAAMAASVSRLYLAAADATSTFVRTDPPRRSARAAALIEASRRAEASFAVVLAEHSQPIDLTAWARVLARPALTRALVIGLVPPVDHAPTGCDLALAALERSVDAAADRLTAVAGALVMRVHAPAPFVAVGNAELDRCVRSCATATDQMETALWIVGWSAMLQRLVDDVDAASEALDAIVSASGPHAWLFGRAGQPNRG